MEIEIQSKTDNLLLGRTEVHFVILHEGEVLQNEILYEVNLLKN